jgi:hypothetical protein
MGNRLRSLLSAVLVFALIGAAAAVQAARESMFPPAAAAAEDPLYLTSGTAVRRIAAGYTAVTADLYWIRAIQYYGGVKLRLQHEDPAQVPTDAARQDYQLLYPLLDLTTTLDPYFNIAYRFGAIFLAEPYPGGAGRPDLAIKLLEKGLAARPDKWEYMQDIGFVHYWWRHDYAAAASWFARAGQVPGAPWFLKSLAATTLAEGGDRQSSRTMWQSIRETAEIDWLRNEAERRLLQLDAADFVDLLQAEVNRARAAGVPIRSWQDSIRAGVVRGVPVDPSGTPLQLDASGRVGLSPQSPLFPLPDEPKRAYAPRS